MRSREKEGADDVGVRRTRDAGVAIRVGTSTLVTFSDTVDRNPVNDGCALEVATMSGMDDTGPLSGTMPSRTDVTANITEEPLRNAAVGITVKDGEGGKNTRTGQQLGRLSATVMLMDIPSKKVKLGGVSTKLGRPADHDGTPTSTVTYEHPCEENSTSRNPNMVKNSVEPEAYQWAQCTRK